MFCSYSQSAQTVPIVIECHFKISLKPFFTFPIMFSHKSWGKLFT